LTVVSSITASMARAAGYGSRLALRRAADRPRWVATALLLILICAAVLLCWGMAGTEYNTFYASAVRSMALSWKAFLFGSFSPADAITIDKIPGYMWPQAVSARLFGFHASSLVLPQIIEALVTVLTTYRLVRRWAGDAAAVLAAGFLALTPALLAMGHSTNEEAPYVMCLTLAVSAAQRAAGSGRLRSLVVSGVWVGLAFQCKMVEAWAIVPAIAVTYLVSAPPAALRRVVHVLVAGLVMIAVSVAWVVAVWLVPANDRPYIDGTINNNPFSMVFGYNALTRFSALGISPASVGAVSQTRGGAGGPAGGGASPGASDGPGSRPYGSSGERGAGHRGDGGSRGFGHRGAGNSGSGASGSLTAFTAAAVGRGGGGGAGGFQSSGGPTTMFQGAQASQIGWLYPLAAASIGLLLWQRRRRPRTDPIRAGTILCGIWILTYGAAYSVGTIHSYYVVSLAPPLAALSGAGAVALWRAFRAGGRGAWLLPVTIAASVVWAVHLASGSSADSGWLVPVLAVLGVAALAVLAAVKLLPAAGRGAAVVACVIGLAVVSAGPLTWDSSVITAGDGTSLAMGTVGPGTTAFGGFGGGGGGGRFGFGAPGAAGGGGGGGFGGIWAGEEPLSDQQRDLLDYVQAHSSGARFVLAVGSWSQAAPFVLRAGASVLTFGGFTGQVPYPTLTQFEQYVADGQLRYVDLAETGGGFSGFGGEQGTAAQIETWVPAHCSVVPATDYGAGASTTGSGGLYLCSRTKGS
jgi:4-amino-4-deoxy-L-arabinose transferase-like glycosyltransferase